MAGLRRDTPGCGVSHQAPGGGGSGRWLLTYADMITLLLAFFVIMYAISKVDAERYQAIAMSIRGAFGMAAAPAPGAAVPPLEPLHPLVEVLRRHLAEDLRAGRLQIEATREAIVLRFQDAVFFGRGKAELTPGAQGILDRLAAVVKDLPNGVEAEGHTDILPIRSRQFPSNWELSAARATAVVRYLGETHGISPLRLAARGLGEHQPMYPNDPVRGEPRNRRVEIRILTGP